MRLIIVFVIAFTLGAVFLVYKIWSAQEREIGEAKKETNKTKTFSLETKDEIVKKHSKKIGALIALNQSVQFHDVESRFEISKFYDNKMHYNRIEPSFLMASDIRENMDSCAKYITKVRENRETFKEYQKKVNELSKREFPIDFDSIKIPLSAYYKRETKLFDDIKLKPVVECLYCVRMSYSSPSGRVNLHKEDFFNFDDMFACFESVSRSHLDKDTYRKMSAVERGEVSDSLRYDILSRDNFTCVLCGASARQGVRLHVDHIVPIAKGGKSTPSNLRTLCERCNVGKSDKIESTPQTTNAEQVGQLCQWCGSKLVLRKGKNGEFYGCSNYPKCRYTKAT